MSLVVLVYCKHSIELCRTTAQRLTVVRLFCPASIERYPKTSQRTYYSDGKSWRRATWTTLINKQRGNAQFYPRSCLSWSLCMIYFSLWRCKVMRSIALCWTKSTIVLFRGILMSIFDSIIVAEKSAVYNRIEDHDVTFFLCILSSILCLFCRSIAVVELTHYCCCCSSVGLASLT
jgi:hypothetical protein